jgi:hypothetical protein
MEISLSHSSGSKYLHQYLREEATTTTTTKQTQNHNLKQKQNLKNSRPRNFSRKTSQQQPKQKI